MNGIKELDRFLTLDEAREKLESGDVLFYEGVGAVSWAIRAITSYPPSKVSHVALLGDHRDDHGNIEAWSVVEFRELRGGREVSLELEVKKNSGRIHVFRPSKKFIEYGPDESGEMAEQTTEYCGRRVVARMREITGLPYNYRMIVCTYLWKLPLLRMVICNRYSILKFLLKPLPLLVRMWYKRRCNNYSLNHFVCSTAIAYAFSKAGYRGRTHYTRKGALYEMPSSIIESNVIGVAGDQILLSGTSAWSVYYDGNSTSTGVRPNDSVYLVGNYIYLRSTSQNAVCWRGQVVYQPSGLMPCRYHDDDTLALFGSGSFSPTVHIYAGNVVYDGSGTMLQLAGKTCAIQEGNRLIIYHAGKKVHDRQHDSVSALPYGDERMFLSVDDEIFVHDEEWGLLKFKLANLTRSA